MPVASHTLSIPITVSAATPYPNPITEIIVLLNTDNQADAIQQVLEQLGGADSVINTNTLLNATFA